jgi:hypothetical protein
MVTSNYIPEDFNTILQRGIDYTNEQLGTKYTLTTVEGAEPYLMLYNGTQEVMNVQNALSLLADFLKRYIGEKNLKINQPRNSVPGFIAYVASADADLGGIKGNFRVATVDTAGHLAFSPDIYIDAGDVYNGITEEKIDTLANWQPKMFKALSYLVGGNVFDGETMGTVEIAGQEYPVAYSTLTRTAIKLRATITADRNNASPRDTDDAITVKMKANYETKYYVGNVFYPQQILAVADLAWASNVLVEYSTDGGTSWSSTPANLAYNVKYILDWQTNVTITVQ